MLENCPNAEIDVRFQTAILRFQVDELHSFILAHCGPIALELQKASSAGCIEIIYFQCLTVTTRDADLFIFNYAHGKLHALRNSSY